MKKDDYLLDDDKEIKEFLQQYTVEKADEDKIEETIDILKIYMPRKKEKHQILKLIFNEITYVNKYYFIISIAVMIAGFIAACHLGLSFYETMMYISPLPVVIGVVSMIKGRVDNMWELEKSYKYSYSKVILSRVLIVISFSCIEDMIFCLFMQNGQGMDTMIRLMVSWVAPISILCSANLFIMKKTSSNNAAILTLSVWFIMMIMYGKDISNFITVSKIFVLLILSAICISAAVYSILKFCKDAADYEGEALWN